jgi:hypothetical protein
MFYIPVKKTTPPEQPHHGVAPPQIHQRLHLHGFGFLRKNRFLWQSKIRDVVPFCYNAVQQSLAPPICLNKKKERKVREALQRREREEISCTEIKKSKGGLESLVVKREGRQQRSSSILEWFNFTFAFSFNKKGQLA